MTLPLVVNEVGQRRDSEAERMVLGQPLCLVELSRIKPHEALGLQT